MKLLETFSIGEMDIDIIYEYEQYYNKSSNKSFLMKLFESSHIRSMFQNVLKQNEMTGYNLYIIKKNCLIKKKKLMICGFDGQIRTNIARNIIQKTKTYPSIIYTSETETYCNNKFFNNSFIIDSFKLRQGIFNDNFFRK